LTDLQTRRAGLSASAELLVSQTINVADSSTVDGDNDIHITDRQTDRYTDTTAVTLYPALHKSRAVIN